MKTKKEKCVHCEELIDSEEGMYFENDDGEHGFICEICEQEAEWDIRIEYLNYSDDEIEFENEEGFEVIEANGYNRVSREFKSEYKRLDGWRGYSYPVVREDATEEWVELVSDNILSMSEDAENLKKLDSAVIEFVRENKIPLARIYSRSSNVFSTGYDLFVPKKHLKKLEMLVRTLKKEYRDKGKYFNTVATGE